MDKKDQEWKQEAPEEEIDWDAFFSEDEEEAIEWEQEKEISKKRKGFVVKLVSIIIAFSMLVSALGMWFDVFNVPAFRFIEASNRLSKDPQVAEYKESVVKIEWDGIKGTGFNIHPDGLIVTNEHVVDHTNRVNVHFGSGDSYMGKVIAKDRELDLAIIEIEADALPYLTVDFENNLDQWKGEKVIFIGNPLSFVQIANEGIIIGDTLLNDSDVPFMMIEAPIYKGNSGSPILSENGKVIGVVFATLRNPTVEAKGNIGVATPSYHLGKIIEEMKK